MLEVPYKVHTKFTICCVHGMASAFRMGWKMCKNVLDVTSNHIVQSKHIFFSDEEENDVTHLIVPLPVLSILNTDFTDIVISMLPLMGLPDTSSGTNESLFCLQSAPNDNPSKHRALTVNLSL